MRVRFLTLAVCALMIQSCANEDQKKNRELKAQNTEKNEEIKKIESILAERKAAAAAVTQEDREEQEPMETSSEEPVRQPEKPELPTTLKQPSQQLKQSVAIIIDNKKYEFDELNVPSINFKHLPGEPKGRIQFGFENLDKNIEVSMELSSMELGRSYEMSNGQYMKEPQIDHGMEVPTGDVSIIVTDSVGNYKKYRMIEGNVFVDALRTDMVVSHFDGAFKTKGEEPVNVSGAFVLTDVPASVFE